MKLTEPRTFARELFSQLAFFVRGLIDAARLQLGNDDTDEILVTCGRKRAREIEADVAP
ncbi:hypothetical protein [Caballeronia sp. RCC_10]|uniref:hypothetical protein n=1 Tax=Caballeronia sp. RCC_10 TaxID=3239227 RepID=UPI003524E7B8